VDSLRAALRSHWPEYLIEGAGLGLFLLSALSFTALLEHAASPVRTALPDAFARRAFMGLAMGATALALVYSPLGRRSGAHFNPALTLTFFRLGKVAGVDAACYAAAQFSGALLGAAAAGLLLEPRLSDPSVAWAVTRPGPAGALAAFAGEAAISGGLVLAVLFASNDARTARFTGAFCALLLALYIALEAPLSGTSMNPARTLASAAGAGVFEALWVYFSAPLLGMLLGAELYLRRRGDAFVRCAKLNHGSGQRCIFRCGFAASGQGAPWNATT
jgi:aquaporin Z